MLFRASISALLLLAAIAPAHTFAQATKPKAAEPTKAATIDPKPILEAAREALAKIQSFSYDAELLNVGPNTDKLPTYTAHVVADRADAGGWRLYAKGDGGGEKDRTTFEIGFDGATARSIRDKEQTVIERSLDDVNETATFFGTQNARPVVAFEILDEKPLTKNADRARAETQQDVDGELCNVIFIPTSINAPLDKPAAGTRYFLSTTDNLPRKIERLMEPDKADAPQQARVLTLRAVTVDANVAIPNFALAIPDGYRVRAPESTRKRADAGENPKPAPKDGQRLGDPEKKRDEGRGLAKGSKAPDFRLQEAVSKEWRTLKDYEGKVVVLDFWGTWCGWCIKAMPQIQRLHTKYADRPVEILGMNVEMDPKADPVGFFSKNKYTYNQLLKADGITTKYKVQGYPTLYVLDQQGKVIYSEFGYSDKLEQELSKVIDAALANPPKADQPAAPAPGGAAPAPNGSPRAANSSTTPNAAPNAVGDAAPVFRTRTGKKYHNENCDALRSSAESITLADARTAGLEPCSRCKPPQ